MSFALRGQTSATPRTDIFVQGGMGCLCPSAMALESHICAGRLPWPKWSNLQIYFANSSPDWRRWTPFPKCMHEAVHQGLCTCKPYWSSLSAYCDHKNHNLEWSCYQLCEQRRRCIYYPLAIVFIKWSLNLLFVPSFGMSLLLKAVLQKGCSTANIFQPLEGPLLEGSRTKEATQHNLKISGS